MKIYSYFLLIFETPLNSAAINLQISSLSSVGACSDQLASESGLQSLLQWRAAALTAVLGGRDSEQ